MSHSMNADKLGLKEARVNSVKDLEKILSLAHNLKVCKGAKVTQSTKPTSCSYKEYPTVLKHDKCTKIIEEGQQCSWCRKLEKDLSRKNPKPPDVPNSTSPGLESLTAKEKKIFDNLMEENERLKEKLAKKEADLKSMKAKLKKLQDKMILLEEASFDKVISKKNLSENTKLALKEILSCAKAKTRNGRRYTDEWIILCLMFHLASPRGYRFVRSADILPLPAISTVRL